MAPEHAAHIDTCAGDQNDGRQQVDGDMSDGIFQKEDFCKVNRKVDAKGMGRGDL
jgi:hypothetical protein